MNLLWSRIYDLIIKTLMVLFFKEQISKSIQLDVLRINKILMKLKIDPMMLKAICKIESDLGRAKSVRRGLEVPSDIQGSISFDKKSWGIMQFTIPTAQDFDPSATAEKLNNADYYLGPDIND